MGPTDAELLALVREGDEQAATTFAERHAVAARVYAKSCGASDADAKDVAQNLLLAMISRPPSALKNSSAEPYMNLAIRREVVRADRPSREMPISSEPNFPDLGTSPSEVVARLELLRDVWHAVACALATAERDVVRLRYEDDLNFAEISAITGRPEATERGTLRRALEKIRQFFRDSPNETPSDSLCLK